MSRFGLFSMLQLAAGLSMAGPMVVLGIELLRGGRPLPGLAFFGLAVIACYLPTYVVSRIGGPRAWLRRRLERGDGADDADPSRAARVRDWVRRD